MITVHQFSSVNLLTSNFRRNLITKRTFIHNKRTLAMVGLWLQISYLKTIKKKYFIDLILFEVTYKQTKIFLFIIKQYLFILFVFFYHNFRFIFLIIRSTKELQLELSSFWSLLTYIYVSKWSAIQNLYEKNI